MTELTVESHLRVRYAETDQMGVVYHTNYLIWMEIGRTDYCRRCGFQYATMEREEGAFLAVAQAQCRFLASARYDDEIVIQTRLGELRSRQIKFSYSIHRQIDNLLLAEGETVHIVINREGRPMRFPPKYAAMLSQAQHP